MLKISACDVYGDCLASIYVSEGPYIHIQLFAGSTLELVQESANSSTESANYSTVFITVGRQPVLRLSYTARQNSLRNTNITLSSCGVHYRGKDISFIS